ncbi:MAG: flavodoxin domain-containing protein [Bacilli bacterium]|nr:flavodoxin domain-containing protein [Bacilli bacterium]
MKGLIVYASKTKTTEKCSKILSEELDFKMVNIKDKKPDISNYDVIVIGSYIRMGMIDRQIKKFIIENKEKLLKKKCALYLCCGVQENMDKYFWTNYPQEILECAILKECFGCSLDVNKLKGIEKFVVKMMSKKNDTLKEKCINEKSIIKFVKTIKEIK